MEAGIVREILQQGGLFGIAMFAIWVLKQEVRRSSEREERHSKDREHMWEITRQALEGNTEAMTRLADRLERS